MAGNLAKTTYIFILIAICLPFDAHISASASSYFIALELYHLQPPHRPLPLGSTRPPPSVHPLHKPVSLPIPSSSFPYNISSNHLLLSSSVTPLTCYLKTPRSRLPTRS
ncbi:hypothetical protein AMECASPLE_014003 [Ameca splendens]|uniref:Uncharacterized protein n=1 Tax=Ameca splendens TaxID=208324 RepID=A0ABV0YZG5_9TELE